MQLRELSVSNIVYENSCSRPAISFHKGARYLVFRGADGHLLGEVQFTGAPKPRAGYTVIQLAPGGPQKWLEAVESAAQGLDR